MKYSSILFLAFAACSSRGLGNSGSDDLATALHPDAPDLAGPTHPDLGASWQAVWGSGPADVYIAGVIGLAHSTGDGTWVAQPPSHLSRGYFGLGGRGASDVWALGGDGQTMVGQLIGGAERYDGNGNWSWTAFGSTYIMKYVAFTAAG